MALVGFLPIFILGKLTQKKEKNQSRIFPASIFLSNHRFSRWCHQSSSLPEKGECGRRPWYGGGSTHTYPEEWRQARNLPNLNTLVCFHLPPRRGLFPCKYQHPVQPSSPPAQPLRVTYMSRWTWTSVSWASQLQWSPLFSPSAPFNSFRPWTIPTTAIILLLKYYMKTSCSQMAISHTSSCCFFITCSWHVWSSPSQEH